MNPALVISAYQAAQQAGFTGAALLIATAIAGAESAFDPTAVGDIDLQNEKWGPSVGLWQIRSLKNPQAYSYPDNLRDAAKLKDPIYNAKAAYAISKSGTDFSPWSTFINSAYKGWLDIVEQVKQLGETAKAPLTVIEIALLFIIAYKIFLKK
jgi:hypothetical protein